MTICGHALVLDEELWVFIEAVQMAAALPSSHAAWPPSKGSSKVSWDWKPQAQASKPSHTHPRNVFSKNKIQLPCLLLPNQTTIPPVTNLNHKALPAAIWGSCWYPVPSAQSTQFLLLQLTDSHLRQGEMKAVWTSKWILHGCNT